MNPVESHSEETDAARGFLSALADGRGEACDSAISAWTRDADARRTWHAYQLIGDVLRSEDLAGSAQHDEAFLVRLRQRLASEPVVLAPQALAKPAAFLPASTAVKRPSSRWSAAAAVAGFALVCGAVLTIQRGSDGPQLASSQVSKSAQPQLAGGSQRTAPAPGNPVLVGTQTPPFNDAARVGDANTQQWHMLEEGVFREARLDSYLRAHRGSAAVGGRIEPVALGR